MRARMLVGAAALAAAALAAHDAGASPRPPHEPLPMVVPMCKGSVHACVYVVAGGYPPETVQRTMRQNLGAFRACYAQALRGNPMLAGSVRFTFVISRNGGVVSAIDNGSSIASPEVLDCVVETVKRLSFPAPEHGLITVSYGFQCLLSRMTVVRAALDASRARLALCARSGVEEQVAIHLIVAPDGAVSTARAASSLGAGGAAACVERWFGAFRISQEAASTSDPSWTELDYALTFAPAS